MINPGDLNRRVSIQTTTQSVDNTGAPVDTWATSYKRWAKVRPVRGREPYVNDQRLAELDLVVSVRYDDNTKTLTPKNRILWGSRVLDISAVIDVENRHQEIRLFCTENV